MTDLPEPSSPPPADPFLPPLAYQPPSFDPPVETSGKGLDGALAVLLGLTYGGPLIAAAATAGSALGRLVSPDASGVLALIAGLGAAMAIVVLLYRRIRKRGRAGAVRAAEVLILGILPVWGLAYSHFLGHPTCTVTHCMDDSTAFRPFAEPEVLGLIALHAATVVAYAISRRRPGALRPFAEALVHATLLAGIVAHAITAVHVGRWAGVGVLLAPVFAPCLAPALTVVLYGAELRARLLRRGAEAAAVPDWHVEDSLYRKGPAQQAVPPAPRVHRPSLLRALALGPALLGVHAVIHALWLGRIDGAAAVFTRTCGHVLSNLPVVVTPEECHYLCTVAARGHTWLVKPERLGRRRGQVIVVNRQLAVANAFEDLLHERWPRFGRLARRTYDRLGLPVSRLIRRRWLADLTYLAMKPAEWLFAMALLLLDRGDPEERIDRMYR
jgi:hypothetical protein